MLWVVFLKAIGCGIGATVTTVSHLAVLSRLSEGMKQAGETGGLYLLDSCNSVWKTCIDQDDRPGFIMFKSPSLVIGPP